jgi:hypothetical protein
MEVNEMKTMCESVELMEPCGCVEVMDYCVPDMSMTKGERLDMLKGYKTDLEKEVKDVTGQIKKLQKSK